MAKILFIFYSITVLFVLFYLVKTFGIADSLKKV